MSNQPEVELPPIPFTERYVAPADARRRLTWASVRFTLFASRAQRLFYAAIVVFAVLLQALEGWDPIGPALREVAMFVVIGLLSAVVWASTVGFAQTYHSTRYRYPPGAVVESGFGEDGFVLRGPTGDSWSSYSGLRGVTARGDWVFFSLGIGGHAVFPRVLFPDEQVARINAASTRRRAAGT